MTEYAIPVLGGIEAGLIVTTINPNFTAGNYHFDFYFSSSIWQLIFVTIRIHSFVCFCFDGFYRRNIASIDKQSTESDLWINEKF